MIIEMSVGNRGCIHYYIFCLDEKVKRKITSEMIQQKITIL
jgi:hypothetical protein